MNPTKNRLQFLPKIYFPVHHSSNSALAPPARFSTFPPPPTLLVLQVGKVWMGGTSWNWYHWLAPHLIYCCLSTLTPPDSPLLFIKIHRNLKCWLPPWPACPYSLCEPPSLSLNISHLHHCGDGLSVTWGRTCSRWQPPCWSGAPCPWCSRYVHSPQTIQPPLSTLNLTIAPVQFFMHPSRYMPPSPVVNISTLPQESDNEEATIMAASPKLIKYHVLYYV